MDRDPPVNEALIVLMLREGLTAKRLSETLDISQPHIRYARKGQHCPLKSREKIAGYFGVTVESMFPADPLTKPVKMKDLVYEKGEKR